MLKYVGFSLSILIVAHLHAQTNPKALNGRIIDSTTLSPIPFAYIRIEKSIFVSGQDGGFSIPYGDTNLHAEVKISCVGYKTRLVTIAALRKTPVLRLIPDEILLNQIIISELSPQSIFRKSQKKGFKNYRTPRYTADYTFEQLVFYENADSLVAAYQESGKVSNRGLDTTGTYPAFVSQASQMSSQFLKYDTVSHPLTALTNQRNTITKEAVFTYDPVRVGLLKQFHPVPAMFSKGFYDNTEQRILSIVNVEGADHYLIGVYPNDTGSEVKNAVGDSKEVALYKQKLKDVAMQNGRVLSETTLDSIFSSGDQRKSSAYAVLGFFLVNTQTFGISHALVKVNTFDASGKLFSKLHVAASYIQSGGSYHIQSLDVLIKKTPPPDAGTDASLYYLITLKLSDINGTNPSKVTGNPLKATAKLSDEWLRSYVLSGFQSFLSPVKNCSSCANNAMEYFNQVF